MRMIKLLTVSLLTLLLLSTVSLATTYTECPVDIVDIDTTPGTSYLLVTVENVGPDPIIAVHFSVDVYKYGGYGKIERWDKPYTAFFSDHLSYPNFDPENHLQPGEQDVVWIPLYAEFFLSIEISGVDTWIDGTHYGEWDNF